MNFSGYVVNNVGQGNSFVIVNCIVVGGAGAFTGTESLVTATSE